MKAPTMEERKNARGPNGRRTWALFDSDGDLLLEVTADSTGTVAVYEGDYFNQVYLHKGKVPK